MDRLLQDLRYAARSLRKSPALFTIASLSLAIGIAVNVTIYGAVDILLWRPLPYAESERLVQVWSDNPERGWDASSVSLPDFADWRRESRTMELAAYTGGSFNLVEGDRPERVRGFRVSPRFFEILGTAPARGRFFRAEEETPGAGRVAILSEAYWRNRFGLDSSIVGKTIRLDGTPYTVVGTLPADFEFGYQIDIYTPLEVDPSVPRSERSLEVIGRLRAGASVEAASTEIGSIAARLAALHPTTNVGMGAHALRLQDEIVEDTARRAGLICLVAVTLVLLIACGNVANLLLARATARSRELAVRSAVGADRGRLVRQLVTESVLLGLAGGGLGVMLSIAGLAGMKTIIPADFPRVEDLGLDLKILGYAAAVSILAGVIAGVAPAFQVTRANLTDTLKDGGRSGAMGLRHGKLRASLVVAEMALALVLLISAGLLIKASIGLNRVDLGFDPRNVLSFAVTLSPQQYPDSLRAMAVQEELRERLGEISGVSQAGAVSRLPMAGGSGTYYRVEGEADPGEGRRPILQYRMASAGYFEALGIGLARGRFLAPADRAGAPPAIVVNQTLADRHWRGQDPLGKRLVFASGPFEIVGVVRDVREFGPDDPAPAIAYFASAQRLSRTLRYVVRTAGDPAAVSAAVRERVEAVAPDLPAYEMRTVEALVTEETQGDLIMPRLLGVFGVIALLLAVFGVYGVMAYSVAQRTQELGIRRALGAEGRDIVRMVLRQATRLAGMGAAIGVLIALASTRALSAFLFGVSAFDPVVFAGVTATLMLAAVVASLVPARRATAVDPLTALRLD